MDGDFEQVSNEFMINDVRDTSEFKTTTFSGYKKTDVKKQLLDTLYKSKIENSCYWCAELLCSGHFMDMWECILFYLGKHIHLGNPKLAIYIDARFQVFKNIMVQGLYYDELQLRNSPTIRNMFAEICCVFAISPKKPGFEAVKLNKTEEFDMTQISLKLKAPDRSYSDNILRKQDPKEIAIAINEFTYHITTSNDHNPNMAHACYWVEWLIHFDQICRRNKRPCIADTREHIPVEYKFQKEIIWVIWDSIFFVSKDDVFSKKILTSILNLFCIKFTPASIKKRTHLLYFAISIVTEPYRRTIPMILHKETVENTLGHINTIYKQIKKNECSPQTDYLFAGLHDANNLQKSLHKIDLVNSIIPGSSESNLS